MERLVLLTLSEFIWYFKELHKELLYGDSSTLTTLTMDDKIYTTISRSESANEQGESIWSVTLDSNDVPIGGCRGRDAPPIIKKYRTKIMRMFKLEKN
jgi:hypothetical protein